MGRLIAITRGSQDRAAEPEEDIFCATFVISCLFFVFSLSSAFSCLSSRISLLLVWQSKGASYTHTIERGMFSSWSCFGVIGFKFFKLYRASEGICMVVFVESGCFCVDYLSPKSLSLACMHDWGVMIYPFSLSLTLRKQYESYTHTPCGGRFVVVIMCLQRSVLYGFTASIFTSSHPHEHTQEKRFPIEWVTSDDLWGRGIGVMAVTLLVVRRS